MIFLFFVNYHNLQIFNFLWVFHLSLFYALANAFIRHEFLFVFSTFQLIYWFLIDKHFCFMWKGTKTSGVSIIKETSITVSSHPNRLSSTNHSNRLISLTFCATNVNGYYLWVVLKCYFLSIFAITFPIQRAETKHSRLQYHFRTVINFGYKIKAI